MFIGREEELKKLNQMYESNSFEFGVVYGRRRVGKTTLITEFGRNKKMIYYMAAESTQKENMIGLSKAVNEALMPDFDLPDFEDIEKLFDFIEKNLDKRLIFVIDEYPFLAEGDSSISSRLQRRIDHNWKQSKLMLILCGSSMSFMEEQVLGYKSPLYGRRTAQFKIKPFTYFETKQFGKNYSTKEQAILYGVTGGIPEYLNRFSMEKPLDDNIIDLFFTTSGMLYEEPINLLKQELRNFAIYNAVIKAIASSANRLNEIASQVGVDTSACSNQVNTLITLGLVKREVPFGESETSRKTIYRLKDSMFIFWYRFVAPNRSSIERGVGRSIFEEKVRQQIDSFMGEVFEEICIQYMFQPKVLEKAPFFYGDMGRWWGNNPQKKQQEEIDIMAMEGDSILLGECKWTNKEVDMGVLSTLLERGSLFPHYDKWYYLFAKNEFSETVKKMAEGDSRINLVRLEEMANMLIP
jgi:AAA+ ATPase superfamily predicted ATPase